MPRTPDRFTPRIARAVPAVLLAVLALVGAGGGAEAAGPTGRPEGWQGLLGDRPAPLLGDRWIVVLKAQSLADRVRVAGGVADEARMTAWTQDCASASRSGFLTRLAQARASSSSRSIRSREDRQRRSQRRWTPARWPGSSDNQVSPACTRCAPHSRGDRPSDDGSAGARRARRFPVSTARASRSRCSTPGSTPRIRTSVSSCSRASTSSTREAARSRTSIPPSRDGRSATGRRWPGSSSGATGRPG